MLKLLRTVSKLHSLHHQQYYLSVRTFLSQAYYCNEVWEHRLRDPIISKVNLDELYQDLEQTFNKTRTISAVDVDIFANAVNDTLYVDELLDLVHKLRLSADTKNTLNSMSHAVVRFLTTHGRNDDLLKALDDRLNYGLFLDHYTANILMDTYYKNKDFMSGAVIASQLMLQEDFDHSLTISLSLLHCYNYVLSPTKWPEQPKPEEPEEEVKVRVKYLRNPYYDDHFDIRDPLKIVGKTLWTNTKGLNDTLEKSLHLLGLGLHGKNEKASQLIDRLTTKGESIYAEVFNLLPEDNDIRKEASKLKTESADIKSLLEKRVKQAERSMAEKDIAAQCDTYIKWEQERKDALERQKERLLAIKRLADVEVIQKDLKDRETRLWFFENQEQIELEIEAKQIFYPKRWFGKKKKPRKIDEGYIPPEIQSKTSQ